MKITQYVKTLLLLFWNMIAFLCGTISANNIAVCEKHLFFVATYIFNYFYITYNIFKKLKNKINLKENNSTAKTQVEAKHTYKCKNSVSNRMNANNNKANQALKNADYLYNEALKAALAKQNLILKEQIIRLQDKCALLYLAQV